MSIEHGWVDDLLGQRDALRWHLQRAVEMLEELDAENRIEHEQYDWWLVWVMEAAELLDVTAD